MNPGSGTQGVFALLLILFYNRLYVYLDPYTKLSVAVLAEIGMCQVFCTFFASLVIKYKILPSHYDSTVGAALIIVNLSVPLCTLHTMWLSLPATRNTPEPKLEPEVELSELQTTNDSKNPMVRNAKL